MALAVSGLSPVTMTVRRPMRRSRSKRSRMPGLRMSSSTTRPAMRLPSQTSSGVAPCDGDRIDLLLHAGRERAALLLDVANHGVGGPLADRAGRRAGRCRSCASGR